MPHKGYLVMEQYLGRYLFPEEVPHHINGDKSDNRLENLLLCESHSAHMKEHRGRANARL